MTRSQPALPYRVLPPDSVVPAPEGWALIVGDEVRTHVLDDSGLDDWDAQLEFRLEREFRILGDPLLALGLDRETTELEFAVIASSAGVTREVLFRKLIPSQPDTVIEVSITPRSDQIARDLLLTSGIYLHDASGPRLTLAPHQAGSRLWELRERLRLEGGAARLPMYNVPFSSVFAGERIEDAEFHVEIAAEFGLELEAAVSVYLNTERPDFLSEVVQRGSTAERRLWRGVLRRVLLQSILAGVLDDEDEFSTSGIATVHSTVERWAQGVWPDVPGSQLREFVIDRLALCEAQIDAWLSRLEDAPELRRTL